jgi:hypothetical protein
VGHRHGRCHGGELRDIRCARDAGWGVGQHFDGGDEGTEEGMQGERGEVRDIRAL